MPAALRSIHSLQTTVTLITCCQNMAPFPTMLFSLPNIHVEPVPIVTPYPSSSKRTITRMLLQSMPRLLQRSSMHIYPTTDGDCLTLSGACLSESGVLTLSTHHSNPNSRDQNQLVHYPNTLTFTPHYPTTKCLPTNHPSLSFSLNLQTTHQSFTSYKSFITKQDTIYKDIIIAYSQSVYMFLKNSVITIIIRITAWTKIVHNKLSSFTPH